MATLTSAIRQLQQERSHISAQLDQINNALAALNGAEKIKGRKVSAETRAKMIRAQRARRKRERD